MYWDEYTCACQCEYPSASDFALHPDEWFSIDECDWLPVPVPCPMGQYWDPSDDLCYWLDQECPYDVYWWNPVAGICECNDETTGSNAFNAKTVCELTPSMEWNHDRCECQLCDEPDDGCAPILGHETFWNPNCCECQCIPWLECAANEYFDYVSCDCALQTPTL